MGTESTEQESKTSKSKTVKSTTKSTTKSSHLQSVPPPPATQVTPIAVTPSLPTAPPPPYTPQEYRTPEPAALQSTQNPNKFNHNASKYKCCCGCMHYKTATLTIGIIECIIITLHAIGAIVAGIIDDYVVGAIVYTLIVVAVIYAPVYGCYFVGCCKKTWQFFIPYFILVVVRILGTSLLLLWVILVMANAEEGASIFNVHGAVWIVSACLWIIIQIWWIYIVGKCSKYFCAYRNSHFQGVVYNNGEGEYGSAHRSAAYNSGY